MKITKISLEQKASVYVLLVLCIVFGLLAYLKLPVEAFPEIKQPVVIIAVPYVGVSPSDLETIVVDPIEKKLKEIAKVKKMTSSTVEGYSNITVEFEPDVDIDEAVRKVREKVSQAKPDLPIDLEEPIIQEINFENIPIMLVSIVGEQSLVKLKKIAEEIEDKIEQIPGVLDVTISGGVENEVKINVNPSKLHYYNVGVDDVINAIRNENITIPGGSVESGNLKYTVRVPGQFGSVSEIKNIVVKAKESSPIYLRDVADVFFGFKEQTSYSRLSGNPSVTLSIQKRSGENIIKISDEVKNILDKEKANFPSKTSYVILNDLSKDIRSMVSDLENNIIAGLILVVGVLYFFMGARNGFLVGFAVPLSMLISFVVVKLLGYTLNNVVLFSLILALGMLVDNSIVVIENIYRHFSEGKTLLQSAKDASHEVSMAVISSTITTLVAFAPMIFWPGIVGEFMSYLPITLIITLSSSLFIALVFNPVMASTFMKIDKKSSHLAGDKFLQWLVVRYEATLRWVLSHRKTTIWLTIFSYIGMIVIFVFFNHGIEFFPEGEPRQATIKVEAPISTRIETSDKIVAEIEKRIKDTPDMENYVANVGSSSDGFDFGGSSEASHKSQVTIDFYEKYLRKQSSFLTLEQVAEKVKGIPGARIDVTKPQEGPPTGSAVEIQIKGNDFKVLSSISEQIQKEIQDVDGISKLKDNYEKGKPELRIRVDREKAALFELNTLQIANTIRTAINGTEASTYRIGQDEYDITVRFGKDFRESYNDLLNLTIFHEGVHYPLTNFAKVEISSGLSNLNHLDKDRVVIVTADAFGRSAAEVVIDVKEKLKNFKMPEGYSLIYGGQDQEQKDAEEFLSNAFLVAVFLIFFVLVMQFNSVTIPFVIMISVVLSFFGVFLGLLVTFQPFGIIMTGIGVISLAGVVVNNAIVLIDYIQKLRENGMNKFNAIVEAGKTRLRPVILTAITTILGLIPLTVGINIDFIGLFKGDFSKFIQFGAESSAWWVNMGVVVIFGLFVATLLTLVVVPVLYFVLSDVFISSKTTENTKIAEA
ncbi:efflux RND transporter permease subunit [bacterium]|nr:efflux RND transporter permease subunit [bacterium]